MSNSRLFQIATLGRPLHLIGGLLFFGLGNAIAAYSGHPINWPLALGGLLAVWTIQLMTHYSNEYFDLEADLANQTPTAWSGGSRVLIGGQIAPAFALRVALAFAMLGVGTSVIVTLTSPAPWPTALLLALALGLAWSYSAPPLRLNWCAMGELTGALLVPGLTTLVGFQLQTATLTPLPLLAIVPLCCFQFAMLVAVNYPDAVSDTAVGKTTLVVLLGGQRAAQLHLAALVLPYLLLPLLISAGLPWQIAALLLCAAPLAGWLGWRVARGAWHEPAAWDGLGFWSIGLLMSSAGLELAGFLLLN
ncbi:MAG: prenyltransferase [Chloroflexales bacterium]